MKKTALVLAALMTLGILSGCGTGKISKEGGDVTTLTWYVPGDKQEDIASVMEAANAIIEPEIGAKLDMQFIDTGSYEEKVQMKMAANEEMDLMFVGYINRLDKCVSLGGLMEMEELINENCPELMETVPDYVIESAKVNGKLYAFPNQQIMAAKSAISVRKDLAEEFGLDCSAVKDVEDLTDFYNWLMEKHPEVYPMRAINMASAMPTEYYAIHDNYWIEMEDLLNGDGKIDLVVGAKTDEARQRAEYLWKWYQNGWIRNDVMVTSTDSADYSAGKYATFYTGWKPGGEAAVAKATGHEYECIIMPKDILRGDATSAMIGISRTCKQPEKAVKLINLINTNEELYKIICLGIEGKHYTVNDEGKAVVIEGSGYNTKNGDWKFGNQFNAPIREGQGDNVWEETKKLNDEAITSPLSGFVFDNTSVAAEVAAVQTVIEQYNVQLYGAQNPAEYWDEMIKKMENAGVQKICDEMERQMNEFMQSNNRK